VLLQQSAPSGYSGHPLMLCIPRHPICCPACTSSTPLSPSLWWEVPTSCYQVGPEREGTTRPQLGLSRGSIPVGLRAPVYGVSCSVCTDAVLCTACWPYGVSLLSAAAKNGTESTQQLQHLSSCSRSSQWLSCALFSGLQESTCPLRVYPPSTRAT
jgi:hypothetical protein